MVAEEATKGTSPAGVGNEGPSAEGEDEAFECFAAGWVPVAKDTPPEGGAEGSSVVAGEGGDLIMAVSDITG